MRLIRKVLLCISASVFLVPSAIAQNPTLFFSDITSGPSAGGENGNGALVTIYGNNLDAAPTVLVGGTPGIIKVATSSYLWYQRLTLQIPSTVGLGPTTISISNTNGSSNPLPFTVRAGNIFVLTSASQLKAARSTWTPGDIYYLQGTWSVTGDDGLGWRSSFSIFGEIAQNFGEGTEFAPIAIVGYPGSNVTIGGGADFGIRADRSYMTFANVSLRGNQTSANPSWSTGLRYIADDISAPNTHVQMGCWTSNYITDVKFLGNNIHNCGTSASDKEDHAVYFSTDVNSVEMAWNADHDNQTCYGVQFHSSPITAGSGNNQYDLHVHDNQFYNQVCSAVNFATIDPSKGTVEMYNNLVYNAGTSAALSDGGGAVGCLYLAGITNNGSPGSGAVQIYNNTFYKCGPTFLTDNDLFHPVNLNNDIVQMTSGSYVTMLAGNFGGSSNLWYGAGTAPTQTTGNISADAQFRDANGADFHVSPGSPVIATGSANSLPYDIEGTTRAIGSAIDIGAYASAPAPPIPDLTIMNAHDGTFSPGDAGKTYTITVMNAGSASTNTDVWVMDLLPPELTATSMDGAGWSCTLATLICTRSDVLTAGSAYPAITLTVNIAAGVNGMVTDTATVVGGGESYTSNDTSSDSTVVSTSADLTIMESHAGSFLQGQNGATYTITVTNSGGIATTGTVTVVDTLPAGLVATAISGAGWTCTQTNLTCARSDALATGASYTPITLTVNVALNAAASVTNIASVSGGGELNNSNDVVIDVTTILTPADLVITKSHTGSFTQGQIGATYSIAVSNHGSGATSQNVSIIDILPTGLTATAMSGTGWNCSLATLTCGRSDILAAGASYPSITLAVNVASNAPASLINTATVSGGGEVNTSNNSASDSASIGRPPADLTITKSHTGSFTQGQAGGMYNITVTNGGGSATAGMVTVVDTLPVGLTATAIKGTTWKCTLAPLACTRSDALAAGVSYSTISVTVNVASNAPSSLTNTASVSGGGEVNTSNDIASDLTSILTPADLTIAKTHLGSFTQGQIGATYTITVTNSGGAATTGTTTVIDTLPTGLTATGISGAGWSCTLKSLTCTQAAPLIAGASYPAIIVTVNVASNAPASVTNRVSVAGGGEIKTSNDTATDLTSILTFADLAITKKHTGSFTQGQSGATYTLTVTNIGVVATSQSVVATDLLPSGLSATSISGTGWSCSLVGLTCTRSDVLSAGASYPIITVTVNVATNAPASLTNTAAVSGGGEINAANDSANDLTTILSPADLTIAKTHSGSFTRGQIGATYTIAVKNSGGMATTGTVTVVDTLPVGLTASAIKGTAWKCTLAPLACTRSDALTAGASYSTISVTVNVATNALSSLTNAAAVSGGGEINTSNNSASDVTTVLQ